MRSAIKCGAQYSGWFEGACLSSSDKWTVRNLKLVAFFVHPGIRTLLVFCSISNTQYENLNVIPARNSEILAMMFIEISQPLWNISIMITLDTQIPFRIKCSNSVDPLPFQLAPSLDQTACPLLFFLTKYLQRALAHLDTLMLCWFCF